MNSGLAERESLDVEAPAVVVPECAESSFRERLWSALIRYAVFAAIGATTVLAVLWKQAQPANASALRHVVVGVLSDVAMVPLVIVLTSLVKYFMIWIVDHRLSASLSSRLALHRRMQHNFLIDWFTVFATWLSCMVTGADDHKQRQAYRWINSSPHHR